MTWDTDIIGMCTWFWTKWCDWFSCIKFNYGLIHHRSHKNNDLVLSIFQMLDFMCTQEFCKWSKKCWSTFDSAWLCTWSTMHNRQVVFSYALAPGNTNSLWIVPASYSNSWSGYKTLHRQTDTIWHTYIHAYTDRWRPQLLLQVQ